MKFEPIKPTILNLMALHNETIEHIADLFRTTDSVARLEISGNGGNLDIAHAIMLAFHYDVDISVIVS